MQSYEIEIHDRSTEQTVKQLHVGNALSCVCHTRQQIRGRGMSEYYTVATIRSDGRSLSFAYDDLKVKNLILI